MGDLAALLGAILGNMADPIMAFIPIAAGYFLARHDRFAFVATLALGLALTVGFSIYQGAPAVVYIARILAVLIWAAIAFLVVWLIRKLRR